MTQFNRDDIDKFFDCDIYLKTRTLWMGSAQQNDSEDKETGVDFKMAEKVIKGLHILDDKSGDPITIIMNNPGGDVVHGMAIYDAIKACRSHVTIKVFGHAMSMGSVILQAADDRVLAPNAEVMIHYGKQSISDHAKIAEKWIAFNRRFDKWMEDLYLTKIRASKPKFRRDRLKKMLDFDTIMTAREAVDLGLADKLLGD